MRDAGNVDGVLRLHDHGLADLAQPQPALLFAQHAFGALDRLWSGSRLNANDW